jgi:hypothetical protein
MLAGKTKQEAVTGRAPGVRDSSAHSKIKSTGHTWPGESKVRKNENEDPEPQVESKPKSAPGGVLAGKVETLTDARRRRSFGAGRRACGRKRDCRTLAPGEERRQRRPGSGKDRRATVARTLALGRNENRTRLVAARCREIHRNGTRDSGGTET